MKSAMEYDASVLTAMQEQFEDKEYDQAEETTVTLPSSVAYSVELSGDGAEYIDAEAFAEGNLVIEGLTAGTSKSVTITITSLLSGKSESATFTVKCAKEVVDFTFVGDLDRSANSQKLDFGSDEDFTDADLSTATVTIGGKEVSVTGSGTELTFGDLSACAVGEAVDITIETDTAIFRGKINVATAFIKDFDTFMLLRTNYWKTRSASDDSKYRDGYYIVTADIDLSATADVYSVSSGSNAADSMTLSSTDKGFNVTGWDAYKTYNAWHGVFDGRGHYLYNLSVGARGIFGAIDDTSVIKNIGFSITRTKNDWWGALAIESRGIIDNCYLVVNSLNAGNHNGSFVGTLGGIGKITNSISVVTEAYNHTGGTRHGLIVGCVTSTSAVLQNVYTINSGSDAAVGVQSNGSASVLDTASSVYGKFASIEALATAVKSQPVFPERQPSLRLTASTATTGRFLRRALLGRLQKYKARHKRKRLLLPDTRIFRVSGDSAAKTECAYRSKDRRKAADCKPRACDRRRPAYRKRKAEYRNRQNRKGRDYFCFPFF